MRGRFWPRASYAKAHAGSRGALSNRLNGDPAELRARLQAVPLVPRAAPPLPAAGGVCPVRDSSWNLLVNRKNTKASENKQKTEEEDIKASEKWPL